MIEERIQRSINLIKQHSQTHQEWIDWFAEEPEKEKEYSRVAGDTKHHKECVQDYDYVLETLDEFLKLIPQEN